MSITGAIVRLSYANIFEPKAMKNDDGTDGVLKYSTCCLIPKTDTKSLEIINAEIDRTIQKGLEKKKFNEAQVKSVKFRRLLRDGDEYYAENPKPEHEIFKGHMFFNASNTRPVGVVDERAQPIITKDTDKIYSGVWARVDCALFPYNTKGNVGIGAGLNNVMRVRDDERLDGSQSAEVAFKEYAATDDKSDLQ